MNEVEKDLDNDLLEKLAEIEHDQWTEWSINLIKTEKLSQDRIDRWNKLFVPYNKLSEEMKNSDRKYAKKVLKLLKTIKEI